MEGADRLLYQNPLAGPQDLAGWIPEGSLRALDSDSGGVELSGSLDPDEFGDRAHWTLWCPEVFPDRIRISWEFLPVEEPGLAMIFFAAQGRDGEDLFSARLAPRDGYYPQYHSGDINTLHLSYLRHKYREERAFRTCNLRKSAGFRMVAQAADPLPPAEDAVGFYRMQLVKDGPLVDFSINDLPVLRWVDDGVHGDAFGGGRIGFRQMAPLRAAYRNLQVESLRPETVEQLLAP